MFKRQTIFTPCQMSNTKVFNWKEQVIQHEISHLNFLVIFNLKEFRAGFFSLKLVSSNEANEVEHD